RFGRPPMYADEILKKGVHGVERPPWRARPAAQDDVFAGHADDDAFGAEILQIEIRIERARGGGADRDDGLSFRKFFSAREFSAGDALQVVAQFIGSVLF